MSQGFTDDGGHGDGKGGAEGDKKPIGGSSADSGQGSTPAHGGGQKPDPTIPKAN
jgi:hypothetical protein